MREAILRSFAEFALDGDTKSAAFLLQRDDAPDSAEEQANNGASSEDQEIHRGLPRETSKDQGEKK